MFWKGLVASSPVILHWLRWKPGSGTEIKIGRDKIIGMEDSSILSPVLCSKLVSLNLLHLAQVGIPSGSPYIPDFWLGCTELSLSGREAMEWNRFTSELKNAGISLVVEPDSLMWAGGDASGIISVKNIYIALINQQVLNSDFSWFFQLWNWKLPLKYKLFIWLAGKGKILTWDSLRRRGWEGPRIFPLCRHAQEDIHHLLIHCEFSMYVWNIMLNFFNLPYSWSGDSLSTCFNSWYLNKSSPICMAAHISWQLWIERNCALFEDRPPSSLAVFNRVLATYNWHPSTVKPSLSKAIDLVMPEGHTLACFDRAARSNGLCCGAGGFFKAHPSRITKWFLNCGPGTNTKAELMGLWASLLLASSWSINHLLVRDDSRVIIDWITQKSKLHAVHVECWKQKTRDLSKGFTNISFQHFPRSYSCEADALSKRALFEEAGRLSIFHCDSGIESSVSYLNIY
jgi:ribonuclease HI